GSSSATLLGLSCQQHRISFGNVQGQLYALWQSQILGVNHATSLKCGEVDLNVLWQVCWQASDFQLCLNMADTCATQLDSRGNLSVQEVQRHFGCQCLLAVDALEINVQYLLLVRVPLS